MPLQISISNVIGGAGAEVILPPSPFTGILISGTYTTPTNRLYAISNLNSTPNATWNTNIGTGLPNYVWNGVTKGDKVYLGGFFTTYNGNASNYFAVVDRNTGAWISGGLGTGFNGSVRCIVVQDDGKIICAGTFTSYNGVSVNRLIRLNPDYTIDGTFIVGGGFNGAAFEVNSVAYDGTHLYYLGNFTNYKGITRNRFVKIRASDGTDDTGVNSGFNAVTFGIALDGDFLYIGGDTFTTYNGGSVSQGLCKINKNTLVADATFTSNLGTGTNARVFYQIESDGSNIYINGSFSAINGLSRQYLAKISHSGVVDPSFSFTFSNTLQFCRLVNNNTKLCVTGGYVNVGGISGYNGFAVIDLATNTWDVNYQLVGFTNPLCTGVVEF